MNLDHAIVGVSSSPDTDELDAAVAAAQAKFKAAKQSGENTFAKYRYATWSDLVAAISGALAEQGLRLPEVSPGYTKELGWVMVGRISHGKSKQWRCAMLPMATTVTDKRSGQDELSYIAADTSLTYALKFFARGFYGVWVEGKEVEVEQDQAKADAKAVMEGPSSPSKSKVAPYRRLENKMRVVRHSREALQAAFDEAEKMTLAGELTEQELSKLQRMFGKLLEEKKEEVANAE